MTNLYDLYNHNMKCQTESPSNKQVKARTRQSPQPGKFDQLKFCQKFNFQDFSKFSNHDTSLGPI